MIVVGGGAGLCADVLRGASQIIKPPNADVANAVGAAIPQVRLFSRTEKFVFVVAACLSLGLILWA